MVVGVRGTVCREEGLEEEKGEARGGKRAEVVLGADMGVAGKLEEDEADKADEAEVVASDVRVAGR